MNSLCPALLIAAPASGHGKTSLTAGLARYHSRRGLRVRCFKTGPDFIDPGWLEQASGRPVYNLDTWIMGEQHCQQLLYEAAEACDLILVEGVMGLFDGTPSSADLAALFGLPVVPVIDASKMAQTFAAVLHGLATFRNNLNIAGAVANRVASSRHATLLRAAVSEDIKLAMLHNKTESALPSRHLGLKIAAEIGDLQQRLDLLADAVATTFLAELPAPVAFIQPADSVPIEPLLQHKTIAVARDNAFCFLYPANLDCLRSLGANLVFFSPLNENVVPNADAIYLPGGYPELYAERLSTHTGLRDGIQQHVAQHKPLLAECGGMLVLGEKLEDMAGVQHAMCGVLPGTARMSQRLSAIGSQLVRIENEILRGHTFHYSRFDTTLTPCYQAQTQDGGAGEAVYRHGPITASYLHGYFPSNPALVASWFLSGAGS